MIARFKEIFRVEHLRQLIKESKEKPMIFFKHSVVCPISKGAFRELGNVDAEISIIVVGESTGASAELSRIAGIRHDSPQLVIFKDEKMIFNAAQTFITAAAVNKVLEDAEYL